MEKQNIDSLIDEYHKVQIINTLPIEQRVQYIDKITEEYYKVQIINTLPENQRVQYIDKITKEYYKVQIINSLPEDQRVQYIDKITDESYKIEIINTLPEDQRVQYIDKITDEYQKAQIINSLPEEQRDPYIGSLVDNAHNIYLLSKLSSDEIIIQYIDRVFKDNTENLKMIRNVSGISYKVLFTSILSSRNNYNNFIELISDSAKTTKFTEIFKEQNYILEKKHIDTVLEAILSEEFKLNNKDIWEIFSRTKMLCEKYDVTNITQILMDIIKYSQSTSNLVGKELKQFIDDYSKDPDMLKKFIIELVNKNENALNRLKTITSQYINLQMETYKIERKKDIYDNNLLSIDRKIERNYLIKYLIEHEELNTLLYLIYIYYPMESLPATLNGSSGITIKEVLEWKKNNPQEAPKEIKSCFKDLNSIFTYLYENNYKYISSLVKKEEANIKYDEKYKIDGRLSDRLLLSNDLIKLLQKENDEEYKIVKDLIEKYHLLGFGNVFDKLFENVDIDNYDLDNFVSNIFGIAKKLENNTSKDLNLINLLKTMASFDESLIALLGEQNQRLIVTNPGPNASTMTKGGRIDELTKYIKMMYERKNINVPTIDKNISLSNGKICKVNIGNFTDPINLTYGERTASCMRIGGTGEKLLDFCLGNEAGFHIQFSTQDGEFVSRVSGFRVGNTVFLNELRNSVLPEYSDADVLEACKKISEEMIHLSQNSEYPIENVVAANQYVLEGEKHLADLDVFFPKDGQKVPEYFDVNPNSCVLLATSNKDKTREFVPFKDTPLPKYQVLRSKVKTTTDSKEINNLINRVRMTNEILEGSSINEIELGEDKQFKTAFIGEDFYVTIDINDNIDTYIMPNSLDKERALLEIKNIKDNLIQQKTRITTSNMTEETFSSPGRGSRGNVSLFLLMIIDIVAIIISIYTIIHR